MTEFLFNAGNGFTGFDSRGTGDAADLAFSRLGTIAQMGICP